MKKIITLILIFLCFNSFAQNANKKWIDVNYANDAQVYHNLDIHIPHAEKTSYKVIVIIYGSAWFANNMKGMAFQSMGKPLLDAGFAVISINHRSSSDAKYPAQINDVKAAIRFIRANAKKYNLDSSFIGITGFSSGGHLASLAGTTNGITNYTVGKKTINLEGNIGENTSASSKVDAVVDWFGPVNLALMEACEKPKDEKSPEAAIIGGNPADNLDMINLLSPTTFIDKTDPDFLIIHGDADSIVPYCQSVLFAKSLKEKGILVDFITVPNGQHGPVTFNETTFKKMTDFFLKEAEKK
ncbi:Esterase/lipase [Flavobacterium daejeonense]|nr:Esterase/lipase [Flavobacterium daejeonense]